MVELDGLTGRSFQIGRSTVNCWRKEAERHGTCLLYFSGWDALRCLHGYL